jgi:rare lipoprotein A
VKVARALAAPWGLAAVVIAGCHTAPSQTEHPVSNIDVPQSAPPPSVPQAVPDAVPRVEPRSRYGNPPFYNVLGKRYYVLSSSVAYVERGVASWYGPGFHEVRTSTGERYDMYGMTAAHKTLPLPAYVRVTNLQNGRSVVVRVNDRGPFVGNRIIDLSYTAASRLDMLRNGTAMVEVRALDPTAPRDQGAPLLSVAPMAPAGQAAMTASNGAGTANLASANGVSAGAAPGVATPGVATPGVATPGIAPGSPPATVPGSNAAPDAPATATRPVLFVQAGAFADPANAERLAAKLRGGGYGKIFVRDDLIAGRKMYRVRIGPVAGVPEFDRIVAALERTGVHDAHLALD